jgi:hypothetical protein
MYSKLRKDNNKKNPKHKYHKYLTILTPDQQEEEDRISAVTDATVDYSQTEHAFGNGKRRTSRKKRRTLKRTIIKRRTSKKKDNRTRSFGMSPQQKTNFRLFLIIVLISIIRSYVKGKPYNKNLGKEIETLELGAINGLAVSSLLDLIGYFVGNKIRDRIVLGYIFITMGIGLSNMLV